MTRGHIQHQRSPGGGGIYYQLSLWRGGEREGRGGREGGREGGKGQEERGKGRGGEKRTNTSTIDFIPKHSKMSMIGLQVT